jgi:TolB-like protein/Tfp pilus assembly protein PilF
MTLFPGTKLGPYEIQSPLGAGGMGEVYRATDTKLGRDIALKVLPAEMAQDPERLGRFRREAKALAQLDHPNIVTIHSVEECDGIHFLTMQLVDGLPLDRLIPQGGLPVEQIAEIAGALGDALAAAHEKGIVHRDLKPANVMVSNEGRVKVLDFGLAKDVRTANPGDATMTSDSRTQVGVVMGTPAYMSPEQTSGRALDHRSDIFSMGVVLYEMATGRLPFEGSSPAELVSAILRDSPPSVTDLRPSLPSDLARIVRRCLEKDPRHRMQTARDVSNEFRDLSRLTTRSMAASRSPSRAAAPSDSGTNRADQGFWVAVLPFKYAGASAELKILADALSEEIVVGLSRFSYLRVIARSSTAKYSSESGDVRAVGKELGARYLMEGSLRQAGARLRLAVQLVDASSGAHLWAETYDRAFQAEQLFELQDELVPRIVSTVGETHGVLPYSMSETLRNRDPNNLTAYEAVLRGFAYFKHVSAEEHIGARAALERAVEQAPGNADCWAMLAMLYREENNHGYNVRPDPVGRGLAAARRAVDLAPSNHLAHHALASVLYFRREKQAFRSAAQRAMELNPMDGFTLAYMGFLLSYSGEWERGCALMEKARNLNPNHPGWYWFPPFFNAYRKGEFREALELALKVNMPGFWRNEFALAVTYGQLGEQELAQNAARELLAIRPNFNTIARQELTKWWQPELVEQLIDGLRKAGVEVAPEKGTSLPLLAASEASGKSTSGTSRAAFQEDEGFWVAVLPFKYAGASAELKALADGLSEEIVTGLSRFSYLRVIARGSTAKYSSESGDVRAIGKELGARYLMEGSLRQAGSAVRLAVQLIDAMTGTHLWAETFERTFRSDEIFTLQDQLVPRIVSTVADQHGILPRSIGAAIRKKSEDEVSPYEAVFRVFSLHESMTPQEHAACRGLLERVVRDAPDAADCWAMLATLYSDEDWFGFNLRPDPLGRAAAAAQRATDLAPASLLAVQALAQSLFMRHEWQAFRPVAERTIALNPMEGATVALMGILLACSGDWERGCSVADSAMQLHPNFPGWYWLAKVFNAYRTCDYRAAVDAALRIQMPGYSWTSIVLAAAYGQLGEIEAARKALKELLAVKPNFGTTGRQELEKWFESKLAEHFMDGLRKAGLEIPEVQKEDPKQTSSGAVSVSPSIAVLPFANMSDDKEQDYFSDGLAEEIINLLAQVPGLKVIARTSAFAFRGKEQDIRGIAEVLGVNTVLEGSVRRSGSRIRVTAQLINAADGSHLWSDRYDRELRDIFAVQDEISAAIAKALRVKLSREAAPQRYTPKLEAYEAYLKGRQQQVKVTPESLELARRYYEQAIELDPAFGMAHIGLAFYWMTLAHFGQHSVHEGVSAARAEVQRALQIHPSLADGHALLGYLAALFDSDWAAAEKHFDFPMAKQASFELVKPMYGGVLYLRGNAEEAIKLAEHAVEEDPLDVWAHMNLHAYLQAAGRDDEALEQLKKVVELDPNQVVALASMVMIHADKGEIAQALKIARRAYAVGRWFPDTVGLLAALLRRNGEEEESRSIAKELGSAEALGDCRAHALFHLICGEIDQGADWVEKAIEQRDSSMRFYLGFVICKGLRASHRWPKIAKMVNLRA